MLTIQVRLELADEIESAFQEWHAGLSPLEWQDVAALERLLQVGAAGGAETAPVHYRVEQRFIVFLKDRAIVFEEVSAGETERP